MKASAPMSQEPPPPYAPTQGMYPSMAPAPQYPPVGMPQPQQPYGQPMPQVAQVIVAAGFGPHSMRALCNNCNQQIVTQTFPEAGLLTWILSGVLCVMGCVFGCCLIPCCVRECQDIIHKCPNCKTTLGMYRRL